MTTTLLSPRFSNSLRLTSTQRMPIGLDTSSHSVIPMLSFPVFLRYTRVVPLIGVLFALSVILAHAGDPVPSPNYQLAKRTTVRQGGEWSRSISTVGWEPRKVALVVCDVWDYHHSINAVRRLDEMLPSMDALLRKMRAADTFGNDDANALVIELNLAESSQNPVGKITTESPILYVGDRIVTLGDHWQWNRQPTPSDTNLPLPAKFALPPTVFYSADVR